MGNRSKTKQKYNGAIALMTVIIVMAIVVSISIVTLLQTIDLGNSGLGFQHRIMAEFMHYNCIEESMNVLKQDISYTGSISLGDSDLGCTGDISNLGPGLSSISVQSFSNGYTFERTVTVDITELPLKITD